MARRMAREAAMKLLYQQSFSDDKDEYGRNDLIQELTLEESDIRYLDDVLEGWISHREEIDVIIRERARGWRFERLSRVDLSILRLALYELLYREDIPASVSINEGVELAKKYGSEKSGAFINGILGTYLRSGSESDETDVPE